MLLTINQFDSEVIDLGVLGEFGCQIRKMSIRKVNILMKNLGKSLFDNQAGYLRPIRKVNCIEWGEAKGRGRK